MIKQRIILIILTVVAGMFLQGCSTPTVHLYAKYINEAEQKELVGYLEEKNFVVEINQLTFPEMINSSAIIYSPFLSDIEKVHELESVVSEKQWPINYVSALKEGNHWFKKNTIGLFIVPKEVNPHSGKNMQDLALKYQSKSCDSEVFLTLNREGSYEFSREVKDTKYNYGKFGHWRMRSFPYLELKPLNKDRWLYFEVKQTEIEDKLSLVNIYTLKPMENYSALHGCEFEYGKRS